MKKLLSVAVLTGCFLSSKAQTEIGVSFASSYPTQRPANVDLLSSSSGIISLAHSFKLKNNWSLQPQFLLQGSTYIMDGIFKKNTSNQYEFTITPDNYKQSALRMYSFKVPVLLRYAILKNDSNEENPLVSLGFGPYAEYIFSAQQKYKIGTDNFKEKAAIQNKFQYGIAFEMSIYGKAIKKNLSNVSMHVGIQYQLSDYLKDNSSFKPVMPYIGLSIGF